MNSQKVSSKQKQTDTPKTIYQQTLSAQLSVGFALIVFVTVALISLTANLLISRQFEKYVEAKQREFSDGLAAGLSDQYDAASRQWNLDYIHGFGMYALNDGYILKIYDTAGQTVWDAENHDMTLCHQIMNRISLRMKEEKPELNGDFVTFRYTLRQQGNEIGYADISHYAPYAFNENDFRFIDSLNQILMAIGCLSLIGAVAAGTFLATRIARPIVQATEITREISKGNYEIRLHSSSRTAELQELTQAVNHMAESLKEQETLRRRLTTDVAHELRTPLANVCSHLEAILEGIWDPTAERLQSCYDELIRISAIVKDLEKLRQIEAENLHFKRQPVDLLSLVQSIVSAFEPELAKKSLTCMVQGGPLVVLGDPNRLHQAVFNVFSNAVKYSYEGQQISVQLQDDGKNGLVSITDLGIGIPEKELPLIFERFYRTDRSRTRKTGGAGIGLTIARAVVLAHGGDISARSREGKGTTFVISLPKR